MGTNIVAAHNTAVGSEALAANIAANNTAVGHAALDVNTTGAGNTAVGRNALGANTTAETNTAVGYGAGAAITTGVKNVILGVDAGDNITTGQQSICIGNDTSLSAVDGVNQIVMGQNVTGNANSSLCFGDQTTDSAIAFGATSITAPSDVRLKEDIQDEVVGLDFINELRPVTFRWKKAKDVPEELVTYKADSEKRVMNGKYNHGFIAQEVKEAIDNNPDIKEGFDMWSEDDADGRQRIGEGALVTILTKAIQELSAKVEVLEKQLNTKE